MDGGTAPPGDMKRNNSEEDEAQSLLKKLDDLQCSPELSETISCLITDYKKHPEDWPHLIQHLKALEKELTPKSGKVKEEKNTGLESEAQSQDTSGRGWKDGFLSLFKSRQRPVKVYSIVTSETYGADEDVLQELKKQNLELIKTNLAECDVLLLFCVVLSRAGSDVDDAMRRVPDAAAEKPVVLVVMHHKRKDDLPVDGPQWSSEHPTVKCHVDVVFHQSKHGLLQCDANKRAINKMTEYMESVKKLKS